MVLCIFCGLCVEMSLNAEKAEIGSDMRLCAKLINYKTNAGTFRAIARLIFMLGRLP